MARHGERRRALATTHAQLTQTSARTTKYCTEKIQETRETHQIDCAEAVKYLRDAADVLEGDGEARGEERRRRGAHNMSSEKK